MWIMFFIMVLGPNQEHSPNLGEDDRERHNLHDIEYRLHPSQLLLECWQDFDENDGSGDYYP